MNTTNHLKFKRLIQTDWLSNKEASFVLYILNILGNLSDTYDELAKMSARGTSEEKFITVPDVDFVDHFTLSNGILDKIDSTDFTEEDINIIRSE